MSCGGTLSLFKRRGDWVSGWCYGEAKSFDEIEVALPEVNSFDLAKYVVNLTTAAVTIRHHRRHHQVPSRRLAKHIDTAYKHVAVRIEAHCREPRPNHGTHVYARGCVPGTEGAFSNLEMTRRS